MADTANTIADLDREQANPPPIVNRKKAGGIRKLYSCRYNGLEAYANDEEGRRFLTAEMVLGMHDIVSRKHPDITADEMGELRKQATAYEPTPEDIGRLVRLTRKEMVRFEITDVCPDRCSWLDILEERRLASEVRRNAARRKKWAERRAAITARPPRERAVLEAIDRQRQLTIAPVTVADIAARVGRRVFYPLKGAALRTVIHRILDRLEGEGVLKTRSYGVRNERWISDFPFYHNTITPVKKHKNSSRSKVCSPKQKWEGVGEECTSGSRPSRTRTQPKPTPAGSPVELAKMADQGEDLADRTPSASQAAPHDRDHQGAGMKKRSRTAKQMDRLKREIRLLRRQLRQQAGDAEWKPTGGDVVSLDARRRARPSTRMRAEAEGSR
jgi:hypothetical protein